MNGASMLNGRSLKKTEDIMQIDRKKEVIISTYDVQIDYLDNGG